MGYYSETSSFDEDLDGLDVDSLVEAFLIDDLTHNFGESSIQEFCAPGGVGDALLEAKVLSNKRTMVRLSKQSDLERRKTIAAIQMARAKHDPLYTKLVKFKVMLKQTRAKINSKYGNKAAKAAVVGQKAYIKAMRNVNLTNSGSGAYLTQDPNR